MAEYNLLCLSLTVLVFFGFVSVGFVSSQGMNFTITDYDHDVQVNLSGRNCVLFQMQACESNNGAGDLQIYLRSRLRSDIAYTIYQEYVLQWRPDYLAIFTWSSETWSTHYDVTGLALSCSQLNWYWISWRDGSIMFGMGQQPGVNSVLTLYDDTDLPSKIRYMSVGKQGSTTVFISLPAVLYSQDKAYCNFPASIDGSTEVCLGKDDLFANSTSFSQVTTKMNVSSRTWIAFQAQATSDVYVDLLFDTNSEPEFSFRYYADNGQGYIYNEMIKKEFNLMPAYQTKPKNPFNSSAFVWLWASWDKGTLMAGKGPIVGRNVLMSYHYASPEITNNIKLVQASCHSEAPCTLRFSACYFLTGCLTGLPNCANCSGPNNCTLCRPLYVLAPRPAGQTPGIVCVACNTNAGCTQCKNLTYCTKCNNVTTMGPDLKGKGTCSNCTSNCARCSIRGGGNCDTCNPTFVYVASPPACLACTPNCKSCSKPGTCDLGQCKTSYGNFQSKCLPMCITGCSSGCMKCSTGNDTVSCSTCFPGYKQNAATSTIPASCSNINECASNPCKNGGSCRDQMNSYMCTCSAGYNGNQCENNIDECASKPCQNGGSCTDQINSYTCKCAAAYSGNQCENE